MQNTPNQEVKIIRTLHNQLIIGKVSQSGNYLKVQSPYNVVPGVDGINLFEMDKEIVGKSIDEISLCVDQLIYFTQPGEELRNAYLQAISGIETQEKKLII